MSETLSIRHTIRLPASSLPAFLRMLKSRRPAPPGFLRALRKHEQLIGRKGA